MSLAVGPGQSPADGGQAANQARATPASAVEQAAGTTLNFSAIPTIQEIVRFRAFEIPLAPIGAEPTPDENADMAAALVGYSQRSGPDDFSALTAFLERHPHSSWNAALLTGLGSEYYNTAHYSLALEAWQRAWACAKDARDTPGNATISHAVSELAYMYARLGRMTELEALLKLVERRAFIAGEAVKINGAREGLWMMKNRPEVSFRCGPLALHSIKLATDPEHPATTIIEESVSTQKGLSLSQVAELSKKIGMNYQMAFREKGAAFIVPSVVHWKVGHFAAMVRQEGERYLLQDPTFGNTVWPTKETLEDETSGYFLIPAGPLPSGWQSVDGRQGDAVWGKGQTTGNDPDVFTCKDAQTRPCGSRSCRGMAASSVHLMLVNLQVRDSPVGYAPPVGPPVRFTARYNSRSTLPQGALVVSGVLGVKWTHDWLSFIQDQPQSPMADVKYFAGGGGARTFSGFNPTNQIFAFQEYDQTLLTRTGTNSYELAWPDGSKQVFAQLDGSVGSLRSVYLTKLLDASGNAITLNYQTNFEGIMQLAAITDAIGQVTTFSYGSFLDASITRVTDPFGRSSTFEYEQKGPPTNLIYVLSRVTDTLGLVSRFDYSDQGDLLSMTTPYGTTTFTTGQGTATNATMRFVETQYPDGSQERVEYNQGVNIDPSDPPATVPKGMNISNQGLQFRNTFYWDRNACATAYGDYRKARIYHWMHAALVTSTAGILESSKAPLENRVWYVHPGVSPIGPRAEPTQIGRVLDDGSTQLYTYGYNDFGRVTNMVDPAGRTISLVYDTNGIDLLEVRQTRAANNELLARRTYNAQHRPLTIVDAAGQTNTFTYNTRGQLLTASNPKGETVTRSYDANGYLVAVDGPLPGTNDTITATQDAFGRTRRLTDMSGYALTLDYDAMDRITRVTHPDGTFNQYTYDLLNLASFRDRAGRVTSFEHDSLRRIRKTTDPLGRVTLFDWCRCGALRSLTDPMGRKTTWTTDVQGRPTAKQYPDGSEVRYFYENTSSRMRQIIDEKQQIIAFNHNLDNTVRSTAFANCTIPTPAVTYEYDPNYQRVISMTDGAGTTVYSYIPVTDSPSLGAGRLATVDGPLSDDTVAYRYDELGRPILRAINGIDSTLSFDSAGRLVGLTDALGTSEYVYDGTSSRLISRSSPNGLVEERSYNDNLLDRSLQRITHRIGTTPISEFSYGRDMAAQRITTWSQQAGSQSPLLYTFRYDDVNQLLSAMVTNGGALAGQFAYSYDGAGNRLSEQIGSTNYATSYNALNQINTTTAPGALRTNEWYALNRLVAVNMGGHRTEFAYDGLSRLVSIRLLIDGVQTSLRRFVWSGNRICEERDAFGAVAKRFFKNGVKLESGPNAGSYYYTRDHLGSIRELIDSSGNIRARYVYDPYGRRTRVTGDLESDFGFAGMLWVAEASLVLTHFRAYDPELGRWLSRDPLNNAERKEGPNLYAYVRNEPVSHIDPDGLAPVPCTISSLCGCFHNPEMMAACAAAGLGIAQHAGEIEAEAPTIIESAPQAECLLPTLPETPTIVENSPSILPDLPVFEETLPGIGPDTSRMLGNGPPNLPNPETIPSIAPEVETVLPELTPAQNWVMQTLEETANFRLSLPPELQKKTLSGIYETARIVFGLEWIWR